MFEIGDRVVYGAEGVCRIDRLERLRIGGRSGQYYVLSPVYREGATIYVPIDNERLIDRMKKILTADEINALLDNAVDDELTWIDDANERKTAFSAVLVNGDRREMVRLIRTLYLRRKELTARGKHLRASDEQALRDAEKLLNGEFALVLGIPTAAVPAYIRERIEGPQRD